MINWSQSDIFTSLTHLDGRNAHKLFSLRPFFSELAWHKERVWVLISHAIAISFVFNEKITVKEKSHLETIYTDFSLNDARTIQKIERVVNHDLKAIEQFVVSKIKKESAIRKYLLFGIGSEDVNSIAFGRLIMRSRDEVLVPELIMLLTQIGKIASQEKNTRMIARTHGLPAGVTTFGKELANPLLRLCDELKIYRLVQLAGKVSGEVGNYHSLSSIGTRTDWIKFGDRFVTFCGLIPDHSTTQIVPYDKLIRLLHSTVRINGILLDLCRNMWLYVLLGYVKITKINREVGSAGMPHKVNPIYFEGAEGGLVMATQLAQTLDGSLISNRLSRDFSDSTIRRNIVLINAYSLLSYQSLLEAFNRIVLQHNLIKKDLENHAEVWIEPLKTLMSLHNEDHAYEKLKDKVHGQEFTNEKFLQFLSTLSIPNTVKLSVQNLINGKTPNIYALKIVEEAIDEVNHCRRTPVGR